MSTTFSFLGGYSPQIVRLTSDHHISNGISKRRGAGIIKCRSAFAALARKGQIYICGGADEYHFLQDKILIYNIEEDFWYDPDVSKWVSQYDKPKRGKPVQYNPYIATRRKFCGVAMFGPKSIIVYGGKTNVKWLDDVEMIHLVSCEDGSVHDPVTNYIKPLKSPRSHFAYGTMDTAIPFAIGGFSGYDWLDTVEYFDFSKRDWVVLDSKMSIRRGEIMWGYGNGEVYLCGGWNSGALNTFDILDLQTGVVHPKCNMNNNRINGYCLGFGDLIVVGGGKSGLDAQGFLPLELYDKRQDKWLVFNQSRILHYNLDNLPNIIESTVVKHPHM